MKDDIAKLLLRLTLGALMLFHGVSKITGGIAWLPRMLEAQGMPGWFAYGVYIGEVLAPALVILGWYSRVGAGVIAVNMVFAVLLAHRADLLKLNQGGGWALELQAFFFVTALALAIMGPGRYAINRR
jgi:putative oxidoreductase